MRKLIAAINLTIDGFCDHTAGIADEELHDHYTNLLKGAGQILYGRKTFELMKFWQTLIEKPSGEKSMDDFATAIDNVPKIVFSKTMKSTGWHNATLATESPEKIVKQLKQQEGKDLFVGSRNLIVQLTNHNLIDEYQLCVHPVIIGKGMPLFENLNERTVFTLIRTKTFKSGAITLYYKPSHNSG